MDILDVLVIAIIALLVGALVYFKTDIHARAPEQTCRTLDGEIIAVVRETDRYLFTADDKAYSRSFVKYCVESK